MFLFDRLIQLSVSVLLCPIKFIYSCSHHTRTHRLSQVSLATPSVVRRPIKLLLHISKAIMTKVIHPGHKLWKNHMTFPPLTLYTHTEAASRHMTVARCCFLRSYFHLNKVDLSLRSSLEKGFLSWRELTTFLCLFVFLLQIKARGGQKVKEESHLLE